MDNHFSISFSHVSNTGKLRYSGMITAASCSEVEVDVLTGEAVILRADVLFDCGKRSVCFWYINRVHTSQVSLRFTCLGQTTENTRLLLHKSMVSDITWRVYS